MSLDFSDDLFEKYLHQAVRIVKDWHAKGVRGSRIYQNYTPADIKAVFDEPLPVSGQPPEQLLEIIEKDVYRMSNYNPSPNYYGYITGGGNQAATVVELLRTALNQNNLKWHSAPANSEIEKIVIKWICQFIGYPDTAGGVMVSGGSVGNFLNLAVMRKVKCPVNVAEEGMYAARPMTVYVSAEGHSSIDKAVDMLGMGKKHIRKIPVNELFQIDVELLEQQIVHDLSAGFLPACVIGIAGTTNTGAVDPLRQLGEIARKYNLWYMIDGAYGLPGAGTPLVGHLFDGLELADSILINPHKWFFVPFEVACVIVKNKAHLRDTFSMVPEYLRGGKDKSEREDLMDYNLQLTKDFKALKVWMTFKTYGKGRLQWAIENDCKMAWYAEELIKASDDFDMLAPVPLSIACFRYIGSRGNLLSSPARVDAVNNKVLELIEQDGRVFFAGTKIKGQTALRINLTNHRREKHDVEFLISVLRELGQKAEELV